MRTGGEVTLSQQQPQNQYGVLLSAGDVTQKLRELEVQLIDMRSKTERRFQQVFEELPGQLDREVKRLEQRGHESSKQSGAQLSSAAEQLQIVRDGVAAQVEALHERQALLKARLDDHELKVSTLLRNQAHLQAQTSSLIAN